MNAQIVSGKWRVLLIAVAAAVSLPGAALADQHGNGGFHGGGFHGGAHGTVVHGNVVHVYPVAHPGFYPYARPYYPYAYHPYAYHPYAYGPAFFGGLALGTYVATLPLYYSTYWWGGVPYYYSGNTYYLWNDGARQYQVVAPPGDAGDASSTQQQSSTADLYAYPTKGQSAEQQKSDRYQCHSWAVQQSGFDPTAGAASDAKGDYRRAEAACLQGLGYSVQ